MQLRNTNLPIEVLREQVLSCDAPYFIVTGETGSGKTTRVPVWLWGSGVQVLVAEPLTETTVETSHYVADSLGEEFGESVGNYSEGLYGPDTSLLFAPANPRVIKKLADEIEFDVLIIDELHQWTTDQSVLEAWCWKGLQDGTLPFKQVILMSATLDTKQVVERRGEVPIFNAPGLDLEIEDQHRGDTIEGDVQRLVAEGYDVLVFMPTWKTIMQLRNSLKGLDAELLLFHSKRSTDEEKDRIYESYNYPKVIIATNALETGITISPSPGRDLAVVDSGLEVQVVLGPGKVEQRRIMPISIMQSKQRRARTGRVGKGVYIDHCPTEDRPFYPTPEISRSRLDLVALRMAWDGFDLRELNFLYPVRGPKKAYQALFAVGAIDQSDKVTKVGRQILKLPFNVMYGRMIVEAVKLNVIPEILTIIALLENEDIRSDPRRWKHLTSERRSDLLALLDLIQETEEVESPQVFGEAGLKFRQIVLVRSFREYLFRTCRIPEKDRVLSQWNNIPERRQAILRACLVGLLDKPLLFRLGREGCYRNSGLRYRLTKQSVITDRAEWIIALPLDDLRHKPYLGPSPMGTLDKATAVELKDLVELAPHLLQEGWRNATKYEPKQDAVLALKVVSFFGEVLSSWWEYAPDDHPDVDVSTAFSNWLCGQLAISGKARKMRDKLEYATHPQLREVMENNLAYSLELGEREEFKGKVLSGVLSNNGVLRLMRPYLDKTRCLADITDWEVFRFRNIDINTLLSELGSSVPTLTVGDRGFSVTYPESQPPTILLTDGGELPPDWEELLPDEGLFLPDGRVVAVRVGIGGLSNFQNTNLKKLKELIRDVLSRYPQLVATQRAHRKRGLELLAAKNSEAAGENR